MASPAVSIALGKGNQATLLELQEKPARKTEDWKTLLSTVAHSVDARVGDDASKAVPMSILQFAARREGLAQDAVKPHHLANAEKEIRLFAKDLSAFREEGVRQMFCVRLSERGILRIRVHGLPQSSDIARFCLVRGCRIGGLLISPFANGPLFVEDQKLMVAIGKGIYNSAGLALRDTYAMLPEFAKDELFLAAPALYVQATKQLDPAPLVDVPQLGA